MLIYMIKILKIKKLKSGKKKYEITFEKNGKIIKRKFGALGMSDYTIHKNINRRNNYIKRHLKDLKTNDPTRAGYLSMYLLWNKKTFKSSLNDFKKRLNVYNKTGKFPKKILGTSLKFGTISRLDLLPIDLQKYIKYEKEKAEMINYLFIESENNGFFPYEIETVNLLKYLSNLAKEDLLYNFEIIKIIWIYFIEYENTTISRYDVNYSTKNKNFEDSKKYFIKILRKLNFDVTFNNFYNDISTPQMENYFNP